MSESAPHRRLWPDAGEHSNGASPVAVLTYHDGSELVLPMDNNAVAAAPLVRITGASKTGERVRRRLVWAGVRLGVLRPLLRPRTTVPSHRNEHAGPSLHGFLESVLSEEELSIAVSFGPTRINQKPVVRVLRKDGGTVAFAKIGWSDLTAELVRHEARFLAETSRSPITGVRTPRLLHLGEWEGSPVAVFSPELATRSPRITPEVFRSVSEYTTGDDNVVSSSTVPTYDAGSLAQPWSDIVAEGCTEWVRRWEGLPIEVGRWHGDCTPWNSGGTKDSQVILWDWERTEPVAPIGFDPLNYYIQSALIRRRGILDKAVETAGSVMHAIGVPGDHLAPIVWWYALEIIHRHARTDSRSTPHHVLDPLRSLLTDPDN